MANTIRRIIRFNTREAGHRIADAMPEISFTMMWLCVLLLLVSCGTHNVSGVKQDFNTGLTTTYKNMEPENSMLVMNDEVLGHTDIPLGEKFQVINDRIKGLVEKNGKVSVGCSLLITDKNGKKLMEGPDLFKGNDLFNVNEITYLKCTVSTGAPMQWEEKYDVTTTFWDKYGTGTIVNKVTIRMIDIP